MSIFKAILSMSILLVVAIVTVIHLIECIYYFIGIEWYYRIGPAFHRAEWRSSATAIEAYDAVVRGSPKTGLRVFAWGDAIGVRRAWWKPSAYPRASLLFLDEPDGSTLVYEVRPFIAMALIALGLPVMLIVPRLRNPTTYAIMVAFVLIIAAIYVGHWRYDVKNIARAILSIPGLGVTICDKCGYDLHGRDAASICPECGHQSVALRNVAPRHHELASRHLDGKTGSGG